MQPSTIQTCCLHRKHLVFLCETKMYLHDKKPKNYDAIGRESENITHYLQLLFFQKHYCTAKKKMNVP